MRNQFAVIELGRFGGTIAGTLANFGHEVIQEGDKLIILGSNENINRFESMLKE